MPSQPHAINLPHFILNKNGDITYTNSYGEQLLTELFSADIVNPGRFLADCIKNRRTVFKSPPNVYGIKMLDTKKRSEFLIINLTEFERSFADLLDISSLQHELKNPLTIIDGTAQIIKTKSKNEYILHCSDIIMKECGRIGKLLDNIRFLSELSLNISTFNLINLVDEICDSARILFPEITIRLHIDPSLKTLRADREKLFMALYNIVKNACEAQKEGSVQIFISIDPTIKVFNADKNTLSSMLKFSIIDTGSGISEKVYEKIFTPFFTTKNKGTGLGLVIAREIIEKHQGRIEIVSKANKGTVFNILLPQ